MIQFIDDHKDEFGVEPVCRHLPVAPQTYYAARTREPSLQSVTDEDLTKRIHEIHTSNYGVYGVRKVHAELCRKGRRVARCTVERLMKKEGLRGIRRAKGPGRRSRGRWWTGLRTWSNARSRRPLRTASGLPTLRLFGRFPDGFMPRSSSMCPPALSSVGNYRLTCTPTSLSKCWRWGSGLGDGPDGTCPS